MKPYYENLYWIDTQGNALNILDNQVQWLNATEARQEAFHASRHAHPLRYTYGSGSGRREYLSVRETPYTSYIRNALCNEFDSDYNICFLNRYAHEKHALGWHSDDSPKMDPNHPIAVVSFGQPREIWWRPIGSRGLDGVQKQLLGHGSLFVMPPGFQQVYEHKIPRGSTQGQGVRISMTFRRWRDVD